MNDDLISRYALRKSVTDELERLHCVLYKYNEYFQATNKAFNTVLDFIDHAPSVDPEKVLVANVTFDEDKLKDIVQTEVIEKIKSGELVIKDERPQNEYFDMSKLRLMTVEECAGHTIDYAMGWKACIEWIKKGGADNEHL